MPSKSIAQQRLFGMALAYRRGELKKFEISQEVIDLANSMSEKDLEDFAETKHKDLPYKVKENIELNDISGMGDVALPNMQTHNIGSGDMPFGHHYCKCLNCGEVAIKDEEVSCELMTCPVCQNSMVNERKYIKKYIDYVR